MSSPVVLNHSGLVAKHVLHSLVSEQMCSVMFPIGKIHEYVHQIVRSDILPLISNTFKLGHLA